MYSSIRRQTRSAVVQAACIHIPWAHGHTHGQGNPLSICTYTEGGRVWSIDTRGQR